MRWIKKTKTSPAIGETRFIKKFAWFPTECDWSDDTWTIWLERYWITQEYRLRKKTIVGRHTTVSYEVPEWVTVKKHYYA